MERQSDEVAFSKACAYLNYNPTATWVAHLAGAGSGVVYVLLLTLLWLFADYLVSRGQLPHYFDLTGGERQKFYDDWHGVEPKDRAALLKRVGAPDAEAQALAALPAKVLEDPADLTSRELVNDSLTRPQLDRLWQAYTLWVFDQYRIGGDEFREARVGQDKYDAADNGILSLVVRAHVGRKLLSPAVAWVARWNTWMWNGGEARRPLFSPYLTGMLLLGVLLILVNSLLGLVMREAAARATTEAATRMRRAVYHHTFRLGTLAFRALGPSEAAGVFARHVEAVSDALYTRLTVTFRAPIKFGLLLLFALVLNLPLAMAFLVFAFLVWVLGGLIVNHFRREGRKAATQAGERLTVMRESLMLMRLVKCYLMEQFNQSRVERQLAAYAQVSQERLRGEAIYKPLLAFLALFCVLLLLYVAGLSILNGVLGVAGLAAMATAMVSLYWPLQGVLDGRKLTRRGYESAAQLFAFLERRSDVGQVVGAEFLQPLRRGIEFDSVSLREPGSQRMLLEHVSLTIPAGKRVGLVGPDDLEKHALVYLIPRLLDPTAGEIRIDQHNLRWVTLDSLRAQLATVLQHDLVFHDTVANNIGCGDTAYTLPRIIDAAKVAHAHHFITKLPQGYETPIGEQGYPLSASEKFRIALARAILRDPALLIIEEPDQPLDEDDKALLDDTMVRVLRGRTVIFLPHRISTIRSCDQLILLLKGRVAATGVHKDLLAGHALYRHLHYLEFNEIDEHV